MLPTVSVLRMITVLDPIRSGITALHDVVPLAVPDDPVLVDQVTLAIPERSEAVPVNFNDVRVVAKDVVDG
jgi:hypothetical protein